MITPLQITWFILIGILFAGYSLLAGYDLGIGILHLFAPKKERPNNLRLIAPYWDANEVWLLTGGGALFAAFPSVYATIFSAFYIPLMLVLWALIIRAISIEYRSKVDSPRWRAVCDWGFGIGSLLPTLLFGVALGNILQGLALNDKGYYTGTFFQLLSPFPLLMGLLAVVAFSFHGALFAAVESPTPKADFRNINLRRAKILIIPYLFLVVLNLALYARVPHLYANYASHSMLLVIPLMSAIALIAAAVFALRNVPLPSFIASAFALLALLCTFAVGLFPNIVPATNDPLLSLTIANSSSSHRTLQAMLVIALIGMPLVIAYTTYVHYLFRTSKPQEEGTY